MNTLLYTSEAQATFNKAVQYGQAYFDTLNNYQKALLQEFAQHQLEGAHRTALSLLQKNLDYDYPTGCEGVERGRYWLDCVTAYKPAMAVLELFETPKAIPVAIIPKAVEISHLTIPQLALFLVYSRLYSKRNLSRDEVRVIAEQDGKSGDGLYNYYCKYSKSNNRTGFDKESEKKAQNMILRIKEVLPLLPDAEKNYAENEIVIIEKCI